MYRGRFAPSPTGPLHFGSIVAAAASYLDARSRGGHWLVRMEDLDKPRERPGAADGILRTLEAFSFEWDGPVVYQSRRTAAYREALNRLPAFACGCSRRELRESQRYPGTCRYGLPPGKIARAWRVAAGDREICFEDRVQGCFCQNIAAEIGDFVVLRADGTFSYQLAVVVDDAEQGITDVVRGADLLDSTPRQIWLQRLLGYETPRYLHVPVAVNAQGQKLSKQTLAPAVDAGQAEAILRRALAFLGQDPCGGTPAEIRTEAILRWNPSAIPRVLTAVADQGTIRSH
jgi:glutamyl-Q tRNA(Asp) synthetase